MAKQANQLTRRSFLATTALAAGAMATAGMAGCTSTTPQTQEEPADDPATGGGLLSR